MKINLKGEFNAHFKIVAPGKNIAPYRIKEDIMQKKKKGAFTLVEALVGICILAILGAIWFHPDKAGITEN